MPKPGTLVMVQWKDASTEQTWGADPKVPRLANTVSVGWLRHADKGRITMAAAYSPDSDNMAPWGLRSTIPRGSISKVAKLKAGKR